MKKGFTLIEMLIVVAIIGVLTSFAVPQYKKTIVKARMVEVYTMMDAVRKACIVRLAEGETPSGSAAWSLDNASSSKWAVNVPLPSYSNFLPSLVNCQEILWQRGGMETYQCRFNPRTSKFCCNEQGYVNPSAGAKAVEEAEFFMRTMAQRYKSCDGM